MRTRLKRTCTGMIMLHGLESIDSLPHIVPSLRRRLILRSHPRPSLVLAGGSLAGLELLEVPVADLHVAAVLVEALCEVLGGTGAVVVLLLVLLGRGLGLDGSGGFGGAAAEEAADCVADGRADGDTSVRV